MGFPSCFLSCFILEGEFGGGLLLVPGWQFEERVSGEKRDSV